MNTSCYYDIDDILAQEELIPCTTLFDFSHLAPLDPDARHDEHYLPEGSRIKLPLWAMEKWAMLGFVRLSLPRHYGRKARERLEADPADADLRKRNERFFLAGRMLVDVIEHSSKKVAKAIASTPGWRNARRTAHTQALEQVNQEAIELKRTLLKTYTGERLRRTLDWALSSGGDDDVSHYTGKLTEMEQRLFDKGASAVAAQQHWKLFGNRRLVVGTPKTNSPATTTTMDASDKIRPVTPGAEHETQRDSKRHRVD